MSAIWLGWRKFGREDSANVFLIFFVVGWVDFFPDVAFYYGTALLVPGSLALVLLAIRGAYYAYYIYGSQIGEDFDIYIAPLLTVLASVVFMAIYVVKYKDPSD